MGGAGVRLSVDETAPGHLALQICPFLKAAKACIAMQVAFTVLLCAMELQNRLYAAAAMCRLAGSGCLL